MTDFSLPTTGEIELMAPKDLIQHYNYFAPTAGQNPVKRFETRSIGIKRLTAVADALRSKGVTEAAPAIDFPLIVRPAGWDSVDTTSDGPKAVIMGTGEGHPGKGGIIGYTITRIDETTGETITVANHDVPGLPITGQVHEDVKETVEFNPATATEEELLANGFVELEDITPPSPAPLTKRERLARDRKEAAKIEVEAAEKRASKKKTELSGDAAARPAKAPKVSERSGKVTRSARCRQLIKDGLDNDGIWAVLKVEEKLADDKKNYIKAYAAGQRRAHGL